jgi:hypothetical protein
MDWNDKPSLDELPEAKQKLVLPAGTECDFVVVGFAKKTSKAGNPMAELNLDLRAGDDEGWCYEYLVLNQENCAWKIRGFFEAIGLNEVDWNMVDGATGRCVVEIEPAVEGRKEKNRVARYIKADAAHTVKREPKMRSNTLDDVGPAKASAKAAKATPETEASDDNLPF